MESRIKATATGVTETTVSRSTIGPDSQPARRKEAPVPLVRVPQSVMVIGREPQQILETVPIAQAFDIVFVEPLEQAYSMVKQASPDLIVLWLPIDDQYACQVLSMLKMDPDTCQIPLLTYDAGCEQAPAAEMN